MASATASSSTAAAAATSRWGPGYDNLVALPRRPENLPSYAKNRDGTYEMLPDEPFCRFRDEDGYYITRSACTKKFTSGNIRAHIDEHLKNDTASADRGCIRVTAGGASKVSHKERIINAYGTLWKCVELHENATSDEEKAEAMQFCENCEIRNPKGDRKGDSPSKPSKVVESSSSPEVEEGPPRKKMLLSGVLKKGKKGEKPAVKAYFWDLFKVAPGTPCGYEHEGDCGDPGSLDCAYWDAFEKGEGETEE